VISAGILIPAVSVKASIHTIWRQQISSRFTPSNSEKFL